MFVGGATMRALFVLMFVVLVACSSPPPPVPEPMPEGTTSPPVDRPRRSYIGNVTSKVFHREGCPECENIDMSEQRLLEDPGEAVDDGYRPCKVCTPFKGW